MDTIPSQITSLTIVCSIVYSDADQRKHQSSASLAFVRGIHRGPVNSPHKWPVTRKMFPFDDVIMTQSIFFKIHTRDTSFLSRVNYGVTFLIWNNGLCSTFANAVLHAISHCTLPVWLTNYIHHRLWGEITYPYFPNFSGVAIEVWVWISNFISHFPGRVIT